MINLGKVSAVVAVCLACLSVPAQATLQGLMPSPPDITASFVDVEYDHVSGVFDANGFATHLKPNATDPLVAIGGGLFSMTATLDPSNGNLLGGTVSISGVIPSLGANSGTLLTGNLAAFFYQDPPGGQIFEATFFVTGGDLAGMFDLVGMPGGTDGVGGIVLDIASSGVFNGAFTSSFRNGGLGNADVFAIPRVLVPEPTTMALCLAGLGAGAWRRRRVGA